MSGAQADRPHRLGSRTASPGDSTAHRVTAARAIASLLVTLAIVLGSVIGLAVIGGIGWLAWRARRGRRGQPIGAPRIVQAAPDSRPRLEASRKSAIGPAREVHNHVHVSAILRTGAR